MAYYADKSRATFNNMSGLPVKTVRVNEGTVTRLDAVEPTGGTTPVITYSMPILKGDLVTIDTKYSAGDDVVVTVRIPTKTKYANGIAVSSPRGTDSKTPTSNIPSVDDMRVIDVAFFGQGIIEFLSDGNITAGQTVIFSTNTGHGNYVISENVTNSVNGTMIAMKSTSDSGYCPVLLGAYGYDEVSSPTPAPLKSESKKNKED